MAAVQPAERKAGLIDALVSDAHLGHARGVLVFDDDHWHVLTVDGMTPTQIGDRLVEIAFELSGKAIDTSQIAV